MKKNITWVVVVLLTAIWASCSAITEFDEDLLDEGTDDLYSLEANVADPVQVQIQADGNCTLTLNLTEPLPTAEGGDQELLPLLGGTIQLGVINNESTTSVNLNQGALVNSAPANPGEYQLALSANRLVFSVTFRNEVAGKSLVTGGDYTALITVLTNDVFLAVDNFSRDVIVLGP